MDGAMEAINGLILTTIAAMLAGCGVGCLYHETGKVVVVRADSRPSPERVVEVVGDSLRPLGFSGRVADKITPQPLWYWDLSSAWESASSPLANASTYLSDMTTSQSHCLTSLETQKHPRLTAASWKRFKRDFGLS